MTIGEHSCDVRVKTSAAERLLVHCPEASRLLRKRLERALTTNQAETDPRSEDPRLTGRTYAIPFDRVWTACVELVQRSRGWTPLQAHDLDGFIRVRCRTLVFKFFDDVEIRVSLDDHAMTRVDMTSRSRKGRADFGTNARRIGRFLKGLDRKLGAEAGMILDPTVLYVWPVEAE